MKKNIFAMGALLAAATLASCGGISVTVTSTAAAYGLTHGGSYVSEATVTVTDGKITEATINEVCFPTYVSAETASDDTVAVEVTSHGETSTKNYYKTFSYDSVTYTWNADLADYAANGTAFKANMATEDNAEAYYNAVMADEVSVTLNGAQDKTIMTHEKLCKVENGYWVVDGTSHWIQNRDATIAYLLENGIDSLLATSKNDDGYWANGTVVSGATWNDMNSDTTGKGYYSYAQLLKLAYDRANA